MNNASAIADVLTKSSSLPNTISPLVMDLNKKAWTVELEYFTAETASADLEEAFGKPRSRIPFVSKTWHVDGTTVVQRGRHVTVIDWF